MSKGKRKDQRIELSDGWAQYLGDDYWFIGQVSFDDGPMGENEAAMRRLAQRHDSVVISLGDIHKMVEALAA